MGHINRQTTNIYCSLKVLDMQIPLLLKDSSINYTRWIIFFYMEIYNHYAEKLSSANWTDSLGKKYSFFE